MSLIQQAREGAKSFGARALEYGKANYVQLFKYAGAALAGGYLAHKLGL